MKQHDLLASLETHIQDADHADCASLIGQLERMKALAWGKMLAGPEPVVRAAEELLTVPEVAARLRMSSYRVYELARQGVLKSVRLGKSVRVKPSAVADYLAKQGA
jgi:excisionase family DNA binding protein